MRSDFTVNPEKKSKWKEQERKANLLGELHDLRNRLSAVEQALETAKAINRLPLPTGSVAGQSTDYLSRQEVWQKHIKPVVEAFEKVRGFGREDMGAQQLADYVTEVAEDALALCLTLKPTGGVE